MQRNEPTQVIFTEAAAAEKVEVEPKIKYLTGFAYKLGEGDKRNPRDLTGSKEYKDDQRCQRITVKEQCTAHCVWDELENPHCRYENVVKLISTVAANIVVDDDDTCTFSRLECLAVSEKDLILKKKKFASERKHLLLSLNEENIKALDKKVIEEKIFEKIYSELTAKMDDGTLHPAPAPASSKSTAAVVDTLADVGESMYEWSVADSEAFNNASASPRTNVATKSPVSVATTSLLASAYSLFEYGVNYFTRIHEADIEMTPELSQNEEAFYRESAKLLENENANLKAKKEKDANARAKQEEKDANARAIARAKQEEKDANARAKQEEKDANARAKQEEKDAIARAARIQNLKNAAQYTWSKLALLTLGTINVGAKVGVATAKVGAKVGISMTASAFDTLYAAASTAYAASTAIKPNQKYQKSIATADSGDSGDSDEIVFLGETKRPNPTSKRAARVSSATTSPPSPPPQAAPTCEAIMDEEPCEGAKIGTYGCNWMDGRRPLCLQSQSNKNNEGILQIFNQSNNESWSEAKVANYINNPTSQIYQFWRRGRNALITRWAKERHFGDNFMGTKATTNKRGYRTKGGNRKTKKRNNKRNNKK